MQAHTSYFETNYAKQYYLKSRKVLPITYSKHLTNPTAISKLTAKVAAASHTVCCLMHHSTKMYNCYKEKNFSDQYHSNVFC